MSTYRQITTEYIYPPIPYRHLDWIAYRSDGEGEGDHGTGKTELDAIINLIEWETNK